MDLKNGDANGKRGLRVGQAKAGMPTTADFCTSTTDNRLASGPRLPTDIPSSAGELIGHGVTADVL
jgi:hypothetical protein